MANDKRVTPRISIQDSATVKIDGEHSGIPCTIDNLSQGGVRFSTTRDLSMGGYVELRIPSPDDEADIVLKAQILRVLPGREEGTRDYACQLESVENA